MTEQTHPGLVSHAQFHEPMRRSQLMRQQRDIPEAENCNKFSHLPSSRARI
jgi:hypothetical protein